MVPNLNGPWLAGVALVLVLIALARGPRPAAIDVARAVGLMVAAVLLRAWGGLWGPLHVNGQGPLWIRGAIAPDALVGYGPGYSELLGWTTWLASPDIGVFTANALLSGLSPALLYAAARLAGVGAGGAFAAALVLTVDVVSVRMAASEGYVSSLVLLLLSVQTALGLALHAERRGDRVAAIATLTASTLFAAAAARIHPMVYVPIALTPLFVIGATRPGEWAIGMGRALMAAAAIATVVLTTSIETILIALAASPMTSHAFVGIGPAEWQLLVALLVLVVALQRWVHPAWLPLVAIGSLTAMLATHSSFQQHPFWKLCYQRLFLPGLLLGAAALLPRRLQGMSWAVVGAAGVAAVLAGPAWPLLQTPTTEQLEYRFLQETLPALPPGCGVAAVSRAERRIWEIPSYLVPSRDGRTPPQRALASLDDLQAAAASGDCLVYIRPSLCSSIEARSLCEEIERNVRLQRLASHTFPAVPSYVGLPYDRTEIEVVVFRVNGDSPPRDQPTGSQQPRVAALSDGAPITPQFAQQLFERLAPLHEADGCKLSRFDTGRFRIAIGLRNAAGDEHLMEIATARPGGPGRSAGNWALAVPAETERDCAATLAALETALTTTAPPAPAAFGYDNDKRFHPTFLFLASSFVLLLVGTVILLYREVKVQRPSPVTILTVAGLWGAALTLRLLYSPRTFLHEYFHVAETISAYLSGVMTPVYGNTGPALFRLVGLLSGHPQEVHIIFLTNAVLASLAIPAVMLFALERWRSWPHALAAGGLLAVLPHHLRFSAAEDLFILAVTFALWALAIFAVYLRTGRLDDGLLAALALALAMQTRPEMMLFPAVIVALVLLTEQRPWQVLFAWRTLLAFAALVVLLVPRFLELQSALHDAPSPGLRFPSLSTYATSLVLFDAHVTPPPYAILVAVGLLYGLWRQPRAYLWMVAVFVTFTLFSLSIFNNPPYNVRSQLLPMSFTVLMAAGAGTAWVDLWGARRRLGLVSGSVLLAAVAAVMLTSSRGFVSELRDQQLEWSFLERAMAQLPQRATLLTAVEVGGRNLNAFPQLLLSSAGKSYELIDVRRAAAGAVEWPPPGEDLVYYQGMFCHFAFHDERRPAPMTVPCTTVHERYVTEPLLIEDLRTPGYSLLEYAGDGQGPFRIGFFRLTGLR